MSPTWKNKAAQPICVDGDSIVQPHNQNNSSAPTGDTCTQDGGKCGIGGYCFGCHQFPVATQPAEPAQGVGLTDKDLNLLDSAATWLMGHSNTAWARDFEHSTLMQMYATRLWQVSAILARQAAPTLPEDDIYAICDAYESGIGHGLQRDGHNSGAAFSIPACGKAYELGYVEGEERAKLATPHQPVASTFCEHCGYDHSVGPLCQTAASRAADNPGPNAAASVPVPEGYKLVPLEADDDMISAACEAANMFRVDAMRAIEAAIAAAPQVEE